LASLEEFCTMKLILEFKVIGPAPSGTRIDMPFSGTATGPHWEGELPVEGVDYVTVRGDGHMNLDLRGRIGEGRAKIGYSARGISLAVEKGVAEPQELILFETANEDFAFLNERVGVALGRGEGPDLELTIYLVKR
jgi:hypothetical protein